MQDDISPIINKKVDWAIMIILTCLNALIFLVNFSMSIALYNSMKSDMDATKRRLETVELRLSLLEAKRGNTYD